VSLARPQLSRELEAVTAVLCDDKSDWTAVVDSLTKLRRLLLGGCASFPCFLSSVMPLRDGMGKHVRGGVCTASSPRALTRSCARCFPKPCAAATIAHGLVAHWCGLCVRARVLACS
jgi:hypothetical protein